MNRREFTTILGAAVTGLLAGTTMPGGVSPAEAEERHFKGWTACQGLNNCKGKGGCSTGDKGCVGKNTCRGKGGCASTNHVCKGHNLCKGLGGCKTGDQGCKGRNTCRGRGGCAVPKNLKGRPYVPLKPYPPVNGPSPDGPIDWSKYNSAGDVPSPAPTDSSSP